MTSSRRSYGYDKRRAIGNSPSRPRFRSSPQSSPRRAVAAAADPGPAPSGRRRRTIRAVLWDLDGTLTDSVRFVVDSARLHQDADGFEEFVYQSVGAMTGLPLEA